VVGSALDGVATEAEAEEAAPATDAENDVGPEERCFPAPPEPEDVAATAAAVAATARRRVRSSDRRMGAGTSSGERPW
jgi:hypothetical protein